MSDPKAIIPMDASKLDTAAVSLDRARLRGILRSLNDVEGIERTKAIIAAELDGLAGELSNGGPRS